MNNKPVAWMIIDVDNGKSLQFEENKFSEINIPLYTAPRELSDEEINLLKAEIAAHKKTNELLSKKIIELERHNKK